MCVSLQSFGRSGLDPSRCDPKFEVSWMRCDVKGFVTPQMMSLCFFLRNDVKMKISVKDAVLIKDPTV